MTIRRLWNWIVPAAGDHHVDGGELQPLLYPPKNIITPRLLLGATADSDSLSSSEDEEEADQKIQQEEEHNEAVVGGVVSLFHLDNLAIPG
jgi:hypothetical protein